MVDRTSGVLSNPIQITFIHNVTLSLSSSVPRCARDDLHWVWIPDDLPEEVRAVRCLLEHDDLRPLHPVDHLGQWVSPPPL